MSLCSGLPFALLISHSYPIMQDFLRAVESQDIPVTDDLQDLVTGHGAEHWLKWINRYVPIFTATRRAH